MHLRALAMANNYSDQQTTTTTWVPYQPAKDCSSGVCSSYCPQWCKAILPHPPPALLDSSAADGASSARTFSPIVIAVIGFLVSAFLLLSCYTIVTKYCGTFSSPRWRLFGRPGPGDDGGLELDEEAWYVSSPSNGLDEASIGKIAVRKYKRPGSGGRVGTDCAVCLSEFKEDESLRVLPKCSHAFHVRCIDTWLKTHCSCPLCRTDLVAANPPPSPGREPDAVVPVVENPATDRAQEPGAAMAEGGNAINIGDGEDSRPVRRSSSMDFSGGVTSSSRWAAAEQSSSSRRLAIKRSFSSGRLSLTTRQGKGRNAILPI